MTIELLKRQLPEDRSKSRVGETARAEGGVVKEKLHETMSSVSRTLLE